MAVRGGAEVLQPGLQAQEACSWRSPAHLAPKVTPEDIPDRDSDLREPLWYHSGGYVMSQRGLCHRGTSVTMSWRHSAAVMSERDCVTSQDVLFEFT